MTRVLHHAQAQREGHELRQTVRQQQKEIEQAMAQVHDSSSKRERHKSDLVRAATALCFAAVRPDLTACSTAAQMHLSQSHADEKKQTQAAHQRDVVRCCLNGRSCAFLYEAGGSPIAAVALSVCALLLRIPCGESWMICASSWTCRRSVLAATHCRTRSIAAASAFFSLAAIFRSLTAPHVTLCCFW